MHRTLLIVCVALTAAIQLPASAAEKREQPNIVWIVTEDNSTHWLRLYNEAGAAMPNVERLAKESIVFNHAFSNAPVCSVARSTIISGCYAPRVGAQYHRREQFAPLPGSLKMFPHYLREAGYFTTNNSKQDYNFPLTETAWDESSRKATYRHRKPGQPFFHVQNYGTTHEGTLHFPESSITKQKTQTDPTSVKIFPYHPDTPTFRYTYAQQLDHHIKVDEQIGQLLQQLESDNVMDDTIIFFYGDHGGVLPRSKGYVYESGLHVPMVVRCPDKWQHLMPTKPGSRVDGFVSFVDLAPTVLHLAGVDVPTEMDGEPFLGKGITKDELNARQTTFGYADRFDEKYDLVRTWRKGKYKYMRSYQPFNVDSLHNFYRYKMLAYAEWRELHRADKLNDLQSQFFKPRPPETLFDIEADPHEVKNLAGDPAVANILKELRGELQQQVKGMPDLSFYPESHLIDAGLKNPVKLGQDHRADIARLIDIADLSLLSFTDAKHELQKALNSPEPWERYWALIACSAFGQDATSFIDKAKQLASSDSENLVRVRAAEFLALTGNADPRPVLLETLGKASSPVEANLILNSVTLLHDTTEYQFKIDNVKFPNGWLKTGKRGTLIGRRWEYLTTNGQE